MGTAKPRKAKAPRPTKAERSKIASEQAKKRPPRNLNNAIRKTSGEDLLAYIPATIEPIILSHKLLRTLRSGTFSNTTSFTKLPTEILVEVFRQLPTDATCFLAQSCKLLLQIASQYKLVRISSPNREVSALMTSMGPPRSGGFDFAVNVQCLHGAYSPFSLPFRRPQALLRAPRISPSLRHKAPFRVVFDRGSLSLAQMQCSFCEPKRIWANTIKLRFNDTLFTGLLLHLAQHQIRFNEKTIRLACLRAVEKLLKQTDRAQELEKHINAGAGQFVGPPKVNIKKYIDDISRGGGV